MSIITKNTAKIVLGLVLALTIVAVGASSASAAQLSSAQVSAIIGLLQSFGAEASTIANVQASLSGGTPVVVSSGAMFTSYLQVGDRGAEVMKLQQVLNANPLTKLASSGAGSPGNETTYFGPITKAAVIKYQALSGLPGTGMLDISTLAKLNGVTTTTTTTTTTGTTVTTGTTGITTPGVEGSITVTLGSDPSSGTTIREGESDKPVIGIKIEAVTSDMDVQRIKVNLGTASSIYTKVLSKISVVDDTGRVLASLPLDSSTVVQDSSNNYQVTLSGFHYVVKAGEVKVLKITTDLKSSISSTYTGSKTIQIDTNGVRSTDGVGIDQYGPSSAISRSVTVAATVIDSATLTVSLGSDSPKAGEVVANQNEDGDATADDIKELTLATFKLEAKQDDIKITNFIVGVANNGTGAATATTAYLYDASNGSLISSATIGTNTGVATFTDDWYVRLNENGGVKNVILKADIRDANTTATAFVASSSNTAVSITAENSGGTTITPTGTVSGNSITVRESGPIFTLNGKPSIVKSQTASQNNYSTSTIQVTFNLHIKAVGGDISFGTTASGTPAIGSSTSYILLKKEGSTAAGSITSGLASSTSYSQPSSGVTTSGIGGNSWKLYSGNEVDLPVTFYMEAKNNTTGVNVTSGQYAVQLEGIKWTDETNGGNSTSSFMSGNIDWRSPEVTLP
ncbi:MAG: peptidoglycan-binding protein [Patescibacteria group bacterium]|nr:peptidoglycan-binding protein [Patescibacteria group bacterium]